jgi:hypothetical protein
MPEQVMQDIEKTIEELNVKLRNGVEVTIKDVLWPMLAIAIDVKALANVHVECPARGWYITWSKWANLAVGGAVMALLIWILNFALSHGFTIPTP